MKFRYIYLIFFCCLTTSCISTKSLNGSGDACQTIIDSAKIFVQTSEFAVNAKPAIKDEKRNLRLDRWLRRLSFKNLTCLLDNETISLKAAGFMYAMHTHEDSLLKDYSYLMTDTTSVQLFTADGRISQKVKLGELLTALTQSIREDNVNLAKRPKVEEIVSTFIKQYSTYPDTYKPISFPFFSMGSDNKGHLTDFKIHHEYEMKNNERVNVRVVSAFVLDKDLRINIIEKDSTRQIYSYPPKLEYWFKEFGRTLTRNDSLELRLR